MSKIVFKDKKIVIILKPSGVSSQPDNTVGEDVMILTSTALSQLGEPSELYPVHRLDKVVGGLIVFARNPKTAAELSRLVSEGELNKEYLAAVEGDPESGVMRDYLLKDSRIGKAQISSEGKNGAKYAELKYKTLETVETEKGKKSLVKITLITGRFHQIRAQFSSRSHPLLGDKKYGSSDHRVKSAALFAYKLGFILDGKEVTETKLPDINEYPWNLFNRNIYKEV